MMRQTKRRPTPIGETLKEIINRLERIEKRGTRAIEASFNKTLPRKLIKHIEVRKKINNKLIINVESPTWAYEANKHKEKLLREITRNDREIKEIVFKVGRIK